MADWIQDLSVIGGSTSKSLWVDMRATDGTAKTGLAYTDVTATYTRPGSGNTAITMASLASLTASYSSGGWREVANGCYRWDIPDAAIAAITGGGPVLFTLAATGALPTNFQIIVVNKNVTTLADAPALTDYQQRGVAVTLPATLNVTQWGGVNVTGMPMPTYNQPPGFLAATFPASVGTSTYAGTDTPGTTTLLTRVTGLVLLASGYTAPPTASDVATAVASSLAAAHGSGSWATATGFSTLTAADVRTAVGLASASLDTQLSAILAASGSTGTGLSGPSSVTLRFVDQNGIAVPIVDFTILLQGVGRADGNGVASFGLSNGTYTIVARPANGVVFQNAVLTVNGNTTLTIYGTSPMGYPIQYPPANNQTSW